MQTYQNVLLALGLFVTIAGGWLATIKWLIGRMDALDTKIEDSAADMIHQFQQTRELVSEVRGMMRPWDGRDRRA